MDNQFATQSGHFYDRLGNPAYRIIGKNGKERNTTVRDAKEHGFVPSVTTIARLAAAPGLQIWKENNLLTAAATLPTIEGESAQDWMKRVREDSQQQVETAMSNGTAIHGAIELAYLGKPFDLKWADHVDATRDAIDQFFGKQQWHPERSFASTLGFGGKLDLHTDGIIIDFKSKEFDAEKAKKPQNLAWEEMAMQLSAYAYGLDMPHARCANVFISVNHPGLVAIHEWSREDLDKGWRMFKALLSFYYAKTGLQ